jgi:hypothetical protein
VFWVRGKTRPALGPTRAGPGREADHLPPSSNDLIVFTAWQGRFYVYCRLYNLEFLTAYKMILGTDKSGIEERFMAVSSLRVILVTRKSILVQSNLFRTCFRKNI